MHYAKNVTHRNIDFRFRKRIQKETFLLHSAYVYFEKVKRLSDHANPVSLWVKMHPVG